MQKGNKKTATLGELIEYQQPPAKFIKEQAQYVGRVKKELKKKLRERLKR